jgi:hypothetical protein
VRYAGWRDMLAARAVPLCNIALLLTHYSNALFVIVQALFVAFFFGHRARSATRLKSLAMVAGFYASQFAVALAIWGPVALATRKRFAAREEFVVHAPLPGHGPLKIFTDSVVGVFDLLALVVLAVLVLLAMVLIKSARRHFMRAGKGPPLNRRSASFSCWRWSNWSNAWLRRSGDFESRFNARICAMPRSQPSSTARYWRCLVLTRLPRIRKGYTATSRARS